MEELFNEAIKVITECRNNFEPEDETDRETAMKVIEILKVPCECDHYNGFDCGCSQRSFLIQNATDQLGRKEKSND